jgi:hypothetical protein
MAAQVLVNVQLLLGSQNVSPFTGEFGCEVETEMKEANNFAGVGYSIVIPGITKATASLKGFADFATAGSSKIWNTTQIGSQQALGIVFGGVFAAAGDSAQLMRGRVASIKNLTGGVGDVAGFELDLQSDWAEVDGFVLAPSAVRTTPSFAGVAVQIPGGVGAGESLWIAQFVSDASGTNLATTINGDNAVGFPTPVAAAVLPTVSAVGWQFVTVPGPLTDDWYKVNSTIATGSFTYAVLIGVI